MLIKLISVTKSPVNLPGSVIREGFQMVLTKADPQPLPVDSETPRISQYCQKLGKILESKREKSGNLAVNFDWAASHPEKVWLRLQGQLLELLQQLSGKDVKLNVNGHFSCRDYYGNNHLTDFKTADMEIFLPSSVSDVPKKQSEEAKNPQNIPTQSSTLNGTSAFCEDTDVHMSDTDFRSDSTWLENLTVTLTVKVLVEDEYLHQKASDSDALGLICKTIQEKNIHSDVTIVAANSIGANSVLSANRCFLAVHSPVLKAILQGDYMESKTNQIETEYSMECIKSLLEYMYTLDYPEAVKCSKLAVELFQAANYYQMKPLEDKLAEMFLLRGHSWFDVNAAIELFQFAGKIETSSSAELKAKTVKVLKSKPLDQLRKSTNFKKLFSEETAMELCAMAFAK